MKYCLDTSVYIQAHRQYYAFDIVPGFWKALGDLAINGTIISPKSVYNELMKGEKNDELKQWAKKQENSLFIEPNNKEQNAYREIVDFANRRYNDAHWVRKFLDGADPWVIAQAKAYDLIVVTMEGVKTNEDISKTTGKFIGPVKIPNMCEHFNIKCISTYDLMRTLKIGFG